MPRRKLLTTGEKEVIDHRGDLVKVRGTMYKGNLTGAAEYTDKAGNQWSAWFNNDMKHGLCIIKHVNETIQVSTSFNGQYHGFVTFWTKRGVIINVLFQNGREMGRRAKKEHEAYYAKDGKPQMVYAENPMSYI